jgi:mannose/fructose/N-acetylgalactosamine-specific phosphotransferase system component IID
VTRLPSRIVVEVFLRSFAIQGSWNYRTLQGSGFAFALMPALRHVHGHATEELQDAVARHTALFNAHPYLSGVALGAVARMEADGEAPELIDRFKTALRGSLGTLGDRIVWAGWRPACVLLALFVLLATESAMAAIVVFLLVYNAAHFSLRWWGLQVGLRHGKGVAEALRQAPLLRWHNAVIGAAALLLGATIPLVVAGGLTESRLPVSSMLLPIAAIGLGWLSGAGVRLPTLILLVTVAVAGFLLRLGL